VDWALRMMAVSGIERGESVEGGGNNNSVLPTTVEARNKKRTNPNGLVRDYQISFHHSFATSRGCVKGALPT
jgi:hypothetical protein